MLVEDLEEIRNVLALYCHVIDGREWGRIGEVFAPDGSYSLRGSETHEGLEALVEYYSSALHIEALLSWNHHIELGADGVSGTGVGRFLVFPGAGALFAETKVVAGDFDDRYVKTDRGWRLSASHQLGASAREPSLSARPPDAGVAAVADDH